MTVRVFAIVLNIVGGLALLGGALYSFVRDMSRTYNIFLGIGGLLPMLGGSLLGLLNNSDVFFEFELGGTVFLFIGFVMSARYINKKSRHENRYFINSWQIDASLRSSTLALKSAGA